MNSFEKFLELYRIDSRYPTEIAQGFLWYHCLASEEKSTNIPTILLYYQEAAVQAPSSKEIESSFNDQRNGVSKGFQEDFFRLGQAPNKWFMDNYFDSVFCAGLQVLVLPNSKISSSATKENAFGHVENTSVASEKNNNCWDRLKDSSTLKPGIFGMSLDLKKLFSRKRIEK